MPYIPLNHSKYAVIDDEDFDIIAYHKWYFHKGYAVRTQKVNGKKKMIYMHRRIMKPPADMVVDHINGNGLDNRRNNLRVCTRGENVRNMRRTQSRKKAERHSRFKGVYWVEQSQKWVAQIRVNKKQVHLGYFENEEDAARTYDMAAQHYFGKFACTNIAIKGDSEWNTDTSNLLNPSFLTMRNGKVLGEAIT